MTTYRILDQDITDGKRGDCRECPGALAVAREHPGEIVSVQYHWAFRRPVGADFWTGWLMARSPENLREFISVFDNRDRVDPVEPIEFELEWITEKQYVNGRIQ